MENPRVLGFKEALKIANKAMESLTAAGKKANICVANAFGTPLVRYRMDSTRDNTAHIALLKARLSAKTGHRTRKLRDMFKDPESLVTPDLFDIKPEEEVPFAGGVPVYEETGSEKTLLGSIGISELSEDEDETFAIEAAELAGFKSDR